MLRALATACALAVFPAQAFKLQLWSPAPSDEKSILALDRQAQAFARLFTVDVHERMTRRAYEMAGVKLPDAVVAGVRWNDNPPTIRAGAFFGACGGPSMQLVDGVGCWISTMRFDRVVLETLIRREKSVVPMRSHFGDMQFLHAMAARSGESAAETRENVLRWSEFAYRVARGEIDPRSTIFGLRTSPALDRDTGAWVATLFRGLSAKKWTVQDMFLADAESVRLKALGSLLHLVQDSYSAAHVKRASTRVQPNGCLSYDAGDAIVQFQTYGGQDAEKHGLCDDAPDWLERPRPGSPLDVMAELVRAYHENKEWAVVKAILEERVFRLAEGALASQPGACFELKFDPGRPADLPLERPLALDPSCR